MKKIKFGKKIVLNKETIVSLTNQQLDALKGGAAASTLTRTCPTTNNSHPAVCGPTGGGQSQTSDVC